MSNKRISPYPIRMEKHLRDSLEAEAKNLGRSLHTHIIMVLMDRHENITKQSGLSDLEKMDIYETHMVNRLENIKRLKTEWESNIDAIIEMQKKTAFLAD